MEMLPPGRPITSIAPTPQTYLPC